MWGVKMAEPWEIKVDNPWQQVIDDGKKTVKNIAPWASEVANPWLSTTPVAKSAPGVSQGPSEGMFERVFANMIQAESGGKHTGKTGNLLESPAGARGITQLMPGTARDPGYGIDPVRDDSETEYLRVGRSYLQAMLTTYSGDYNKALAAYNAGSRNVDNAITRARKAGKPDDWMEYLPKKSETIPYVNKVMKGLQ